MADQITVSETIINDLPIDLRQEIELHLASQENVILCILGSGGNPQQSCIVLTDYKLILCAGGIFKVDFPYEEKHRQPLVISLNQIKKVEVCLSPPDFIEMLNPLWMFKKSVNGSISIDYGHRFGENQSLDPLRVDLRGNETLVKKLNDSISKAVSEAFVRAQNPVPKTVDTLGVGDQLMKLAVLRDKGDLTQAEFEAAKKKLLGL